MSDVAIRAQASAAIPRDYQIPGAQELLPKSVAAHLDGTSTTGVWYPCLQVVDPGGNIMFSAISSTSVAAGASADVSWFPHVAAAATAAPAQTTWVRKTEPLISPSQAWEATVVQEPDVRLEAGTYKMWYTANFAAAAVGYATCTGDPTLVGNWTKFAGNPVIGQGGSGIAGWASGIQIYKLAGTYNAFYYDAAGGGNLKRSTSADGTTWAAPSTAIAKGAVGGAPGGWANSQAWFDGANFWLFVEASTVGPGGPPWAMWVFKNNSLTNDGGWVVQNGGNPISALAVPGYGNGYGQAPNIAEIDGVDTFVIGARSTLWYHVDKLVAANDQTDITHGYTTDAGFVNWTASDVLDLVHNGGTYEGLQVADPSVLQVNGSSYLFFTGENGTVPSGYISVATFPGTLAQLIASIG